MKRPILAVAILAAIPVIWMGIQTSRGGQVCAPTPDEEDAAYITYLNNLPRQDPRKMADTAVPQTDELKALERLRTAAYNAAHEANKIGTKESAATIRRLNEAYDEIHKKWKAADTVWREQWRAEKERAEQYWRTKEATALVFYRATMLPQCSFFQKAIGRAMTNETQRAREYCLADGPSPTNLALCEIHARSGR